MNDRLKSEVVVSGMIRSVSAAGGFATVIAKGDRDAGAIIVLTSEKGQISGLFERVLASSGAYDWTDSLPQVLEKTREISAYLDRRRARDPDIWIVELDIADAQRFIPDSSSQA
jgi:hypothetical protein